MFHNNSFDKKYKTFLNDSPFQENLFFKHLSEGKMNLQQFLETQYQFYYAVIHFTRPMALTAGNIPNYRERVNVIKNLWEEHGEGNLQITHGQTFIELLKRLSKKNQIDLASPKNSVQKFNSKLDEVARSTNYLYSVAAIGIIECMFADISAFIGDKIIENKWLEPAQLIHYSLHKDLDCIHAEDFFSILRPHYSTEAQINNIDLGLKFGITTFLELYSGLRQEAMNEI